MTRKNSEAKPGISAATLRRVVATAPCGFVITDRTRKGDPIIFVNQAYETLTGFAAEEVLGRRSSFLLGEKPRKDTLVQIRKALNSGQSCTAVLRNRRKDGTLFHSEISLAPLPDGAGKAACFIWLFRDVSTRIRREEELRECIAEKESRFAAYVEHANEAVWRLDFEPPLSLDVPEEQQVKWFLDHAYFSEANDATARIYGLARGKDVVGRPLREFMPPSDPQSLGAITEFVRHKCRMDNLITYETTAGGTKSAIANNIKPYLEDGKVRSLWGASLDLSDFFEAQKDLEVSRKELVVKGKALEEKNIALKEFLSILEQEKKALKERIAANVELVLLPMVEKIQAGNGQDIFVTQLRKALLELTSSFGHRLVVISKKLTHREVEVCSLVKNGLNSKDIAQALNIAVHTVEKHRRTARNKLGLANKGINLRTYLNSL